MKGFVFLDDIEIVLRFALGGAFATLEGSHELIYVVPRSEDGRTEAGMEKFIGSNQRKVEWISFYPERHRQWQKLFNASCILYEHRSSSFAIRNEGRYGKAPGLRAKLDKIARPQVYDNYRNATESRMGPHPDLLPLLIREQPDFFVLPSGLLDHITDEVLYLAHRLSIPTLLLIAGWDNLSSKGLIYHQPTLMGVWGEQGKIHAVQVQGANAEKVYVIGAPHFEQFRMPCNLDRAEMRRSWGVPSDSFLVLFAGTFRMFDETALLMELEQAIDSGIFPGMHIIYRPHPLRAARRYEDNFFDHPWRHITMDPETIAAYRADKSGNEISTPDTFFSRMSHLTELYRTVDGVICPMSTVLLEAILFGLPTMAIAFGDGKHSWSTDKVSHMLHFKEFYELPDIVVCRDRASVIPDIQQMVSQERNGERREQLRKRAQYFVYQDDRTYSERLASLVDLMMAGPVKAPAYDAVRLKPGKRFALRGFFRHQWYHNPVLERLRVAQHKLRKGVLG